MKKRLLILCSVLVLIVALSAPAFAAEESIDTYDDLAGIWLFNEAVELPTNFTSIQIEFESNQTNYSYIYFDDTIGYANKSGSKKIVFENGVWTHNNYRTIKIVSKLNSVKNGKALLSWLNDNAIKTYPPPPPPPIYNSVPDAVTGGLPGILEIFGSILVALFTPSGDLFALGSVIAACFVVALIYGGFRLFRRCTPGV